MVALAATLALAPAAHAGGPTIVLGATEDAVRSPTLAGSRAQMDLLKLAGFGAVRITQIWAPGETAVSPEDATILGNVTAAAAADGIEVFASVLSYGSATTPLSDTDQADFAAYAASIVTTAPSIRHVIVGNEPNLNRYWLPQFAADGSDAAATAYESLLAKTYDALKAADPGVEVIGGAVSPRGGDRPGGSRPTHSPTAFIADLGAAYRASGRTTPIMDAFAIHPYEDNSSIAPAKGAPPARRRRSRSATTGSSCRCSAQAFDGTAQAGSTLPIYYDEFGVESQIPPAKASLYTGVEPKTTHPVDEQTQALYYRAGGAARVLPAERARPLPLPHGRRDRPEPVAVGRLLRGRDAEGEPRRRRSSRSRRPGAASSRTARGSTWRRSRRSPGRDGGSCSTCDLDCTYVAQLYRLPGQLARDPPRTRDRRPGDDAAAAGPGGGRPLPAAGLGAGRRESRQAGAPSPVLPPLGFGAWKVSTSRTRSTASIRRGGGSRSRSAGPRKDAFADVIDDFADRFDHLRTYTTTGVRPETDFFLWKITERYDASASSARR